MGIADKMIRFVRGEPLYKPDDVSVEEKQHTAATTPGTSPGAVVPVITINHVLSELTERGMRVHAMLQNESDETLKLYDLELLGQTCRLGFMLSTKEAKRDVVLYDGLAIENSNVGAAVLRYRSLKQDIPYKAIYALESRMVDVDRLGITEFNLQLPISTE